MTYLETIPSTSTSSGLVLRESHEMHRSVDIARVDRRIARNGQPITKNTWGFVYILHFSAPLGNLDNSKAQASHYIGWAEDVQARIAQHRAGTGARITRAAVERGIELILVAVVPAPVSFEKYLKARKATPCFCSICSAAKGKAPRPLNPPTAPGVEFPEDFDFPAPAQEPKADRFEVFTLQQWRRTRSILAAAAAPVRSDTWDEGLL
jgi:putative endonuclease